MKAFLKSLIKKIPFAFTQNQQYDKQTIAVIRKVCRPDSNTLDIGCHKGEILTLLCKYAPGGIHYGFEPIPGMFQRLVNTMSGNENCRLVNVALAASQGTASFNYVISNPAYSGLVKRQYDKKHEEDTTIEVQTDLLDHIVPENLRIDLVKIDVEGGELGVLQGGIETIKRNKPVIIFEHGLGASDYYNTKPDDVFQLLRDCGLQISTMKDWLKGNREGFKLEAFREQYYQKKNYYFIAFPGQS